MRIFQNRPFANSETTYNRKLLASETSDSLDSMEDVDEPGHDRELNRKRIRVIRMRRNLMRSPLAASSCDSSSEDELFSGSAVTKKSQDDSILVQLNDFPFDMEIEVCLHMQKEPLSMPLQHLYVVGTESDR